MRKGLLTRSLRSTAMESRGPSWASARGDLCHSSQSLSMRVMGTRKGLPRARHILESTVSTWSDRGGADPTRTLFLRRREISSISPFHEEVVYLSPMLDQHPGNHQWPMPSEGRYILHVPRTSSSEDASCRETREPCVERDRWRWYWPWTHRQRSRRSCSVTQATSTEY